MCSAHWVVSKYIPCGFYSETLKWHFLLCCANWTEEAQVKQRVSYGFSSLIMALEICLSLRALELGKSWTAIILDNSNGEDCYPLFCRNWFSTLQHDLSTGSVIMVWLYCQVSTPTVISWQGHSCSWQSLQGFDFEILFSSYNLQWLLCWPLFTFEIALTLTAIISRLMCPGVASVGMQ